MSIFPAQLAPQYIERKGISDKMSSPIPNLLINSAGILFFLLWIFSGFSMSAQALRLPTANRALFEPGGEPRYYVGTAGKTWVSGTFGCVRTYGRQMHEGIDIRCLQRDKLGEPRDPIFAVANGIVAYINPRTALSNFGKYIVLRHQIDGLEVYSVYAHLSEIRAGLTAGKTVQAGQTIGIMGRTANTRQAISRDRAHLHFELNFFLNDRFSEWYKKFMPGQRNDHGVWNGINMVGIDPAKVFEQQARQGTQFSLRRMIQQETVLCRVLIRKTRFPWAQRYPALVTRNPVAEKEGVAGYDVFLNFNGLPYRVIPRAASELKEGPKFQLISVNDAEQRKNPARSLVTPKGSHWILHPNGIRHLELLTY
ncbi:MAG TPA: M23 family metallopeptidase [Candidatus Paceibacterota bacterium]|nr:M23 family metallopeptidase [Verrucomicrobiota bacterium]HRY51594.1 M23 family metallopeptidase [Candidatus Paceibacterota bacterium]